MAKKTVRTLEQREQHLQAQLEKVKLRRQMQELRTKMQNIGKGKK